MPATMLSRHFSTARFAYRHLRRPAAGEDVRRCWPFEVAVITRAADHRVRATGAHHLSPGLTAVPGTPKGDTADIPPVMTVRQARTCGFKGIGFSRSGLVVHVDIRLIVTARRRDGVSTTVAGPIHPPGRVSDPSTPAQERPPWPGRRSCKLDRALEMLTDVRVDIGRIAERQTALSDQTASHAKDLGDLMTKHREDVRAVWKAIDELRARPAGLTGKALLAGAGTLVALAVGLVQLLTHVHLS